MIRIFFTPFRLVTVAIALCGCVQPANLTYIPDVHVSLGMAYLQQGNLEKSREALNQAISLQPGAPANWGAMAYLEEMSGNLSAAETDYRRAIQLAPQLGEAHNNYGVFLCRHGRPAAGIQELLMAVKLPSYTYRASAYQNAGVCALKLEDQAAASHYFALAKMNGWKQ